jgi:nucleolar protein TMA23
MNAESYLRRQGWRGSGHSLDATDRGIKKPLLIAHKQDQMGLGKKKAAHTTDDQWWMRAYDQSLQSIGTGQESTLNQIRTKGINRGGLYGFFVKGEGMAGTIDDSTDADMADEDASTPPTSASESEAPTKTKKRKRADDEKPSATSKKPKKATPALTASPDEQAAVTAKIAKMSPRKKAWYDERAAAKGQTVEDILLRRIRKANTKLAKRNKLKSAKTPQSAAGLAFISDTTGDATLPRVAAATPAGQVVVSADPKAERKQQRKERKAAKELVPKKKDVAFGSKGECEKAMKEKKARKKAEKAEKAEKRKGSVKGKESKWGDDKENSQWEKMKKEKRAAREAAGIQ